MKDIAIVALLLCAGAAGCASVPLNDTEKAVRILRKSDAPAACKEIGKTYASGLASLSDDGREFDLKRQTAKLGGDTVTIDRRDENNTLYGTVFKCGVDGAAAAGQ